MGPFGLQGLPSVVPAAATAGGSVRRLPHTATSLSPKRRCHGCALQHALVVNSLKMLARPTSKEESSGTAS